MVGRNVYGCYNAALVSHWLRRHDNNNKSPFNVPLPSTSRWAATSFAPL